jgi:hypothetical protein
MNTVPEPPLLGIPRVIVGHILGESLLDIEVHGPYTRARIPQRNSWPPTSGLSRQALLNEVAGLSDAVVAAVRRRSCPPRRAHTCVDASRAVLGAAAKRESEVTSRLCQQRLRLGSGRHVVCPCGPVTRRRPRLGGDFRLGQIGNVIVSARSQIRTIPVPGLGRWTQNQSSCQPTRSPPAKCLYLETAERNTGHPARAGFL